MRSAYNKVLFAVFLFGIFSCNEIHEEKPIVPKQKKYDLKIPGGFPEMIFPRGSELTEARVELGKKLFFDVLLSKDSTISCATCHNPSLGFADTLKNSPGIGGKIGFRNAPSILNTGYFNSFMLDGGVPTLEIQVVHPLTDTNEMGFGINEVVERLSKHDYYPAQSKLAYGRELDAYVITRALSAYERTLISGDSKYDRYINGQKDALDESEIRGMKLFFGEKLNCSSCHGGFLFTHQQFENNGSKDDYTGDNGRERITHDSADIGKFKVPSLRNVSKTFPYMHDGSYKKLEDVIENYNQGGSKPINQSELIRPLNLTEKEKTDLVHFLRAL